MISHYYILLLQIIISIKYGLKIKFYFAIIFKTKYFQKLKKILYTSL